MIHVSPNIYGGGDCWLSNSDGSTQIKTLASGDTTVVFDNIPDNGDFGYTIYMDTQYATVPNIKPPIPNGPIVMGEPVDGVCTGTITFVNAVTADQAGTKVKLRIIR